MRRRLVGVALALGVAGPVAAGTNAAPAGWRLEAEEARWAAAALTAENNRLRAELAAANEQVRRLTLSLAEATAELDMAKAAAGREDWRVTATAGAVAEGSRLDVVGVNPALNLVVLNGGTAAGVKPGMIFAVVRGRTAVAQVRAVDVREKITGAVMDRVEAGAYPAQGDQAVPRRGDAK